MDNPRAATGSVRQRPSRSTGASEEFLSPRACRVPRAEPTGPSILLPRLRAREEIAVLTPKRLSLLAFLFSPLFQGAANGFLGFSEQAFLVVSPVGESKSLSPRAPSPHTFLPDPFGREGGLAIFTDPSH